MNKLGQFLVGVILSLVCVSSFAGASERLIIHGSEIGIAKFHRHDNLLHPYSKDNVWLDYVPARGVEFGEPVTQQNADGSFTVFFSSFEDLMKTVVKISKEQNQKVSVLNVHGHGASGGLLAYPINMYAANNGGCSSWKDKVTDTDLENYLSYYSKETPEKIALIEKYSSGSPVDPGCDVGLLEIRRLVRENPEFKTIFADDAKIRFLSCRIGLGTLGDEFTKGVAEVLLPPGKGSVYASLDPGLGDWTTPWGMMFLNFKDKAHMDYFNEFYPAQKRDLDFAQPGTLRKAFYDGKQWQTALVKDVMVMPLNFEE
jgi:hypothetical protein